MDVIKVEQPTDERKRELQLPLDCQSTDIWSVWECDPSNFDWHYDQTEIAYIYEGKVVVKTEQGTVEINKGDLVTFQEGLDCKWEVVEKVRKVYIFK